LHPLQPPVPRRGVQRPARRRIHVHVLRPAQLPLPQLLQPLHARATISETYGTAKLIGVRKNTW
jgi:hypothetical protein